MARGKRGGPKAKAGKGGKGGAAQKKGGGNNAAAARAAAEAKLGAAVEASAEVRALLGEEGEDDEIAEFFLEEVATAMKQLGITGETPADLEVARVEPAAQTVVEFLTDYDITEEVDTVAELLNGLVIGCFKEEEPEPEPEPEAEAEAEPATADAADGGAPGGGGKRGGKRGGKGRRGKGGADTDSDEDVPDPIAAAAASGKAEEDGEGAGPSKSAAKRGKRAARKARQAKLLAGEELSDEEGDPKTAADKAQAAALAAARAAGAPVRPKGFVSILDGRPKGSKSMSKDIKVEGIDLGFDRNVLFQNATLSLSHGHKYGLVAANGLGKSTLLRAVGAREEMFASIPAHFDIYYCEQEVVATETTALQKVIEADTERLRLLEEEKMMMDDDELYDGELLTQIHERLDEIEAYSAEGRASAILSGLQFTEEMKQMPTRDFSGGWRMRIALACALFRRPTLLLLDEPTNHLDLLAVVWLESYLAKWKNMLLIVSHDQDFLNTVCTDIMHIEDKEIFYYRGTYDNFKYQHAEQARKDEKAWIAYDKAQKAEKQQRGKQQNTKREVSAKAARSRAKIAEKHAAGSKGSKGRKGRGGDDDSGAAAAAAAEPPKRPRQYKVKFDFPEPDKLSPPVIQIQEAGFSYDPAKPIFTDHTLDFGIDMDSRVCIAGPNGSGKSTLLKLMWGELQPTTGSINVNRHLIIGQYSQHAHEQLDLEVSAIEYLQRKFGDIPELEGKGAQQQQQYMRGQLGRFGLSGETHTRPIGSLSGGQKARVCLAEISLRRPHILFFDEPTNHLDIESIDALIDGLNKFDGGVIVVSHDARLISELNCDLWIVGNNTCTIFDGDMDDYRDALVEDFEERERLLEEERERQQAARLKQREEARAQREKDIAARAKAREEAAGAGGK